MKKRLFRKDSYLGIRFKMSIVFLLLLFSLITQAQSRVIWGRVTDENNEALVGVSVKVKDTNIGTTTDISGNYTINVPANENASLVFTYIGFNTKEVSINKQTTINVELKQGTKSLDEVVVVGYGTQKKTSLTASVASIEASDIDSKPVADLSNSLGGRVAGIIFTQGSGETGKSRLLIS